MKSKALDDSSDKTAWWQASPQAWFLTALEAASLPPYVSQTGGLAIQAVPVSSSEPPFIEHLFTPALDLSQFQELRFWFSSNRIASGKSEHPFYLKVELLNSSGGVMWERWLPIGQPNCWELQQLWLEDLDTTLRQSIATIRLRALAHDVAFTAQMGDLLGVTPQPVQDLENALLDRLELIKPKGGVFWELPESPPSKTLPCIVIIPWSVQPKGELGGSIDIVDNYGWRRLDDQQVEGAYIRPIPKRLQLEYAIDVAASKRGEKAQLLDAILDDFTRTPYFIIDGYRISLIPFMPAPEQLAESMSPGRAPLFFQITVPIEAGKRQFRPTVYTTVLVTENRDNQTLPADQKETVRL